MKYVVTHAPGERNLALEVAVQEIDAVDDQDVVIVERDDCPPGKVFITNSVDQFVERFVKVAPYGHEPWQKNGHGPPKRT